MSGKLVMQRADATSTLLFRQKLFGQLSFDPPASYAPVVSYQRTRDKYTNVELLW